MSVLLNVYTKCSLNDSMCNIWYHWTDISTKFYSPKSKYMYEKKIQQHKLICFLHTHTWTFHHKHTLIPLTDTCIYTFTENYIPKCVSFIFHTHDNEGWNRTSFWKTNLYREFLFHLLPQSTVLLKAVLESSGSTMKQKKMFPGSIQFRQKPSNCMLSVSTRSH
jgi:hypothetical protein